MHVGILGTRGIPASYGGFETFAEELSLRLARRGHRVTVFGRRRWGQVVESKSIQGVTVRYAPTFYTKHLETPVATLTSLASLWNTSYDVLLLCNAANSPLAWIPRLCGVPVAINVDGIERNRAKWGMAGKLWYRFGELASVLFASEVVADAEVISNYYQSRLRRVPTVITYGAAATIRPPGETLARFGLTSRNYLLYVSRFERENNPLGVVQAYLQSDIGYPLVMVGDAPYAQDYIAEVHALAAGSSKASQIIFTGYQFGEAYQELQSHCYCYIQATEVGGTHPALIEAMAYGNAVIVNGTPENREVIGDAGLIYEKNNFAELSELLQLLCSNRDEVDRLRVAAQARAESCYSWDAITDSYERLFYQMAHKSQRRGYHAISGRAS